MRLRDLMPRVATLPLGSGALAGNPFLVDRQYIARELGMVGGVCPNSMDAVSDREYLLAVVAWPEWNERSCCGWSDVLCAFCSVMFDCAHWGCFSNPCRNRPTSAVMYVIIGDLFFMPGICAFLLHLCCFQ